MARLLLLLALLAVLVAMVGCSGSKPNVSIHTAAQGTAPQELKPPPLPPPPPGAPKDLPRPGGGGN
jgi:hypothetical protein